MTMNATAIRFADEEKEWIRSYASFEGKSFSEFVREAALERVEDAVDAQAYREALDNDDGQSYSMEEVMRMAVMAE